MDVEMMVQTLCSETSYRCASDTLNHFYHRDGRHRICPTTLADHIASVGSRMQSEFSRLSSDILSKNGFAVVDSVPAPPSGFRLNLPEEQEDPRELFRRTIERYNQDKPESARIKDENLVRRTETRPEDCIYISIDDVGVKHQKDVRKGGGKKEGKNVENTVIHVESRNLQRVFTAVGLDTALEQLLAWLIATGLLYTRHLRFFSDGASNIRAGLERWFHRVPYSLNLDWYHLEKHLEETLSMALFKQFRKEFQPTFLSMLWAGNISEAAAELEALLPSDIKDKKVKNCDKLSEAIAYLQRKSPYIDCYALRKELGYRNSSNPAEKSNDLIVAQRQKHNGMSWSKSGSGALAVISAVKRNGALDYWLQEGSLECIFKIPA